MFCFFNLCIYKEIKVRKLLLDSGVEENSVQHVPSLFRCCKYHKSSLNVTLAYSEAEDTKEMENVKCLRESSL